MAKKILFVCAGNTCRSVMAEELLKKMLAPSGKKEVEVFSAGVTALRGTKPSEKAVEVMAKEGIDISEHSAAPLTREKIEEADLVLTMDYLQRERVLEMVPQAKEKTFLLKGFAGEGETQDDVDVFDPIGRPLADYQDCLSEIKEALKKAVKKI